MENTEQNYISEYTKRQRGLIVALNIICGILAVTLVGFIVAILIWGDPTNRLVACIFSLLLYLLPLAGQLFFKFKFSPVLYLIYVSFVTLGAFCGSCLRLTGMIKGFDKVQHFTWGYIACFIGLFYLCKTKEIDKVKFLTIIIVFLGISLATSGLWEVFEFLGDTWLGQTAQGAKVNGVVDVSDAMYDIIVHTLGSLVFTAHFCVDRKTKANLGFNAIIADFSKRYK